MFFASVQKKDVKRTEQTIVMISITIEPSQALVTYPKLVFWIGHDRRPSVFDEVTFKIRLLENVNLKGKRIIESFFVKHVKISTTLQPA